MPGEPFKKAEGGVVATVTEVGAQVSPEVASVRDKETFAQEMHFQVYRIENVLKITSPDALKDIAQANPELVKQPALMSFFNAYGANKTSEFIEQAKTKSGDEREKLLDGIRKLIFKASLAKKEAEKGATEGNKKQAEEQDKEILRTQELLTKELSMEDIADIETDLTMPFDTGKGKMDLNKIQHYYMKIIAGQRAFGTHMQVMQENYGEAIKKFESFNKKYTSGWRKYAGAADWVGRKVSGAWGGLKKGFNSLRGKKTTPEKSESEKVNEAIAKARDQFREKMDRLKATKTKIDARSAELKKGLGDSKLDIRARLKYLISSEDWTKAKLSEKEKKKILLEAQKKQLGDSLSGVQEKGQEIDAARGKASTLKGVLATKYETIKVGETSLNDRIASVKERISQLETTYKKDDPRILDLRQNVLVPLLKGQDRMAQIKEGTAGQLSNVEEDNQKLDLLKADVFVGETATISQLSKTELEISTTGKEIDVITAKRLELHELLGGMETAYMAIDEFKSSVDTNLDKMLKDNTEAVKAVDQQYDVLKNVKASEPGIGSSLYNTVGLGHLGLYGAFIELPLKYIPRATGYVGAWVLNKFGAIDKVSWKQTEKWHVGGLIEVAFKKYDGWIEKGGFKQWTKDSNWFVDGLARVGNAPAAAIGGVLGAANAVSMLILETPKVLDSIGNMITSWTEIKKTLKGVVHWDTFKKGEYSIWGGKVFGDLAVIFFSAGTAAGASAAVRAGQAGAGVAGRTMAYAFAYSKEIGRNAGVSVKNGLSALRHPLDLGKAVIVGTGKAIGETIMKSGKLLKGVVTGGGLKGYLTYVSTRLGGKMDDLARLPDDILRGGFDMKLVKDIELKKLLDQAKTNGVKSMTVDQLAEISKGLRNEMYKAGTSLGARSKIEVLAKQIENFGRVKIKHEVISNSLATKYKTQSFNDIIASKPSSLFEARRLKEAAHSKLDKLLDTKDIFKSKLEAAIQAGEPAAVIARKKHFFDLCEKQIAGLQTKIKNLSTYELSKMAASTAKQYFSGTWNSIKNLKNIPAAVKKNPMLLLVNPATKLATWPIWISVKYLKNAVAGKTAPGSRLAGAESVMTGKNIQFNSQLSEFANIKAISEISLEINKLLKAGQLKDAVTLYHSARVIAKEAKISITVMDKSFLGFLHTVLPGTAMYMGKVNDIVDATVVNELPNDAKVDMSALKKYEEQSVAALAGLIKAKSVQAQTKPISK